jgi:hypothetical protein
MPRSRPPSLPTHVLVIGNRAPAFEIVDPFGDVLRPVDLLQSGQPWIKSVQARYVATSDYITQHAKLVSGYRRCWNLIAWPPSIVAPR